MHHRSGNQTGGGKDGTSDGGAVAETMGADLRSTQSGKERSGSKQADWGGGWRPEDTMNSAAAERSSQRNGGEPQACVSTLKNMLLEGRGTQIRNTVAERRAVKSRGFPGDL
jgi:hypothetical protein